MKNSKIILIIYSLGFGLTNISLFAPVINIEPTHQATGGLSAPIEIPNPPAPRNISVFLDDGQENPYDALFERDINSFRGYPVTYKFIKALNSTTNTAIFVSESIMNNCIAGQAIIQDFLTLSDDKLTQKYSALPKFSSQDLRDAFKSVCTKLSQNNLAINNAFEAYQASPSNTLLNNLNTLATQANTDVTELISLVSKKLFYNDQSKGENFVEDIIFNYSPYNDAFDSKKWSIGKTTDGSYLLLPKNESGDILPTGFNYDHLDGFNGTAIANPFEAFNKDIKTAVTNTHTNTEAATTSLLEIIKITQPTANPDPSIITFTPETYAKLNMYLNGHGSPKTTVDNGSLAGIDIDFFNKTMLPVLEKAYTQTLTYETCYGADVNAQAAFESKDPFSFTVIGGNSILAPLGIAISPYGDMILEFCTSEEALYKERGSFSTPEEIQKKMIDMGIINEFNQYFNEIDTSIAQGVSNFFNRSQTSIYGITGLPLIQLASTTEWLTANNLRDNLLQVSTIKDRVSVVNQEPFLYNKEKGGGVLVSTETVLTPITIEIGSELPFIVPLSTGKKIHYIKELVIKDQSITTEMFITKSIKPFLDQINNYIDIDKSLADKTIVIDSLKTKDGTVTLVVTRRYAMYTIAEETDLLTEEAPLHYIQLVDNKFSWKDLNTFKSNIEIAHEQATQEFIEIAKIQNISTTLETRQKALNVIGRLRGIVNVNLGINDQLTIWNATQDAIINNNNKPISKEFLSTFSLDELQTFCNIIAKYIITLDSNEPLAVEVNETLKKAYQQLNYKTLEQKLATKLTINGEAALNWYITLTLDDQTLINDLFNESLESIILPNLDLTTLTIKEQILIKNRIQGILTITTNMPQIDELNAQLKIIDTRHDLEKFNQHLQDQFSLLSTLPDKSSFIDWISILEETEKANIAFDISAFFIQELINDPYLGAYQIYKLNIDELFVIKINLEIFSSSSEAQKNSILKKSSLRNGSLITLESAINAITNGIKMLDQSIQKYFSNNLSLKQQLALLNPNPVDDYAKIFKELPFEMQTMIAKNLALLKDVITTDLLNYQKSLLPERIATAATPDDLDAIQADLTAAMNLSHLNYSPTDMPADFQITYDKLLTAQNKRIAEHAPAIPSAGSTGPLNFDPTILNQQTGQPLANTNQDNPTNPINPENTPGQVIQDKNPDFQDKELEDEWKKEHEQEILEEKQAKSAETANEEASKNNNPERIIE